MSSNVKGWRSFSREKLIEMVERLQLQVEGEQRDARELRVKLAGRPTAGELSMRCDFRQLVIETLFSTLVGFELPLSKVDRLCDNIRSELAVGNPYLRNNPGLQMLVNLWLARLHELESETIARQLEDEREASEG